MRTTISASRPRPNGLPKVAGTVCIPMTSRTRSFAATTAWAILYEHHSRFLKENSRYARCFLSPDDYKGWTQGLEKAGYATGGHYADSLQRIIEQNGLQKVRPAGHAGNGDAGKRFGVEEPAP